LKEGGELAKEGGVLWGGAKIVERTSGVSANTVDGTSHKSLTMADCKERTQERDNFKGPLNGVQKPGTRGEKRSLQKGACPVA